MDEICGYTFSQNQLGKLRSQILLSFRLRNSDIETLVAARRSATFSVTCFDLIRFGLIGFDFGFVSVSKRNGGSCPG